jgi:SAM-dependent methyltransferase
MAHELTSVEEIREVVRDRYAHAARAVSEGRRACCSSAAGAASCGCGADIPDGCGDAFGAGLYAASERDALPDEAKLASLGCGNPTAVAELHEGDVVLDLGSGGGIDVLLSARRVGPSGRAYGLEMTGEMLDLARANQRRAGIDNAEFLCGTMERIPLPDGSVDVVISNCAINLSGDKPTVFRDGTRVLRPGGRLAVSDVIADSGLDEATRRDPAAWTGCIAGALTANELRRGLAGAGFEAIEIRATHRVHEHAFAALVTARIPAARRHR